MGVRAVAVSLGVSGAGIVIGENLGLREGRCRRQTVLKKNSQKKSVLDSGGALALVC